MEVSGMVNRQTPCCSSGWRVREASIRGRRRVKGVDCLSLGFTDKGHLQYYYGDGDGLIVRCGGKKEEKKMSKLLKGLSKDLSLLSLNNALDLPNHSDNHPNSISEVAQVLMEGLQHLRAEEKKLKRKKKEEKAKLKEAAGMKTTDESSTSESSDSECGEVIEMTHLRNEATRPMIEQIQQHPVSLSPSPTQRHTNASLEHHSLPSTTRPSTSGSGSAKKIEVCMGNKCKKSGGATLLGEFEKATMGVEGAVVGCKCMGKCRDGPNVRLFNSVDDPLRTTPANPLCIGVGLEDVGLIVANFFGEDAKALSLTPASY